MPRVSSEEAPRGPALLPGACTLNHDGCVVCADAGIPVLVVDALGDDALCEDADGQRARIAVELVAPVSVGEVLLTHGGVAIGKVMTRGELREVGDEVRR